MNTGSATLAIGITGLVAGIITTAPVVAAEPDPHVTYSCDEQLCLLAAHPVYDTDGDGVSDDDERAAGTDPADPGSRPPMLDLARLAVTGSLPSFAEGHTEVVVMPDLTTALPGELSAGASRRNVLEGLGINSKLLDATGISPLYAVVLTAGAGGGSGGPGDVFGRNSMSLIASGSIFRGSDGNLHEWSGFSRAEGDFSSPVAGYHEQYPSHSITDTSGVRTEDGHERSGELYFDLSEVNTVTYTTNTYDKDGDKVSSETKSTTTVTDDSGDVEQQQVVNAKVEYNKDGSQKSHTVTTTVTNFNPDGTVRDTTTTTKTTDSEGNTSTVCTGDKCSGDNQYVNDSAQEATSVPALSHAEIARLIAIRTGSNTTPGPEGEVGILGKDEMERIALKRSGALISYFDDSGLAVVGVDPIPGSIDPGNVTFAPEAPVGPTNGWKPEGVAPFANPSGGQS